MQTGDRTAAKTIAERYLPCTKQGYKASFIDDQVRAVRALAGLDLRIENKKHTRTESRW
ncbi:MAG: hypothetical protein U0105_22765 [Candidatus Obscuribacterales bacterium]